MKNKILKIVLVLMLTLGVNLTSIYAQGATIDTAKNVVKPGETVELDITLSTDSIGYDVKIEAANDGLIEKAELVSKIGQGNTSRVYLVQLAPETERTVYEVGTKIAKIKYTISENAKDGDKITIKVTGDVAGKNSTEKNTLNESLVLTVEEEKTVVDPVNNETNNNGNNNNTEQNNNENINTDNTNKEKTNTEGNVDTKTEAILRNEEIKTNQNQEHTKSQNSTEKTNTTSKTAVAKKQTGTLPKAGNTNDYILYIIGLIVIAQAVMGIKYIKSR